jgi:hypothetical protein
MTDLVLHSIVEGRWSSRPTLKPCCQRVVDTYTTLFDPPRESAALHCPSCNARIVCHGGHWVEEA